MSNKMTESAAVPDLLPCPFCNGSAEVRPEDVGSGGQHVSPYHAGCPTCYLYFTEYEPADAIVAWNRRAVPSAPVAEIQNSDDEIAAYVHQIQGKTWVREYHYNARITELASAREHIAANKAPHPAAAPSSAPVAPMIAKNEITDGYITLCAGCGKPLIVSHLLPSNYHDRCEPDAHPAPSAPEQTDERVDRLLDAAFGELQHDTGPQDKEYIYQRKILLKKFNKILNSRAALSTPPAPNTEDGGAEVALRVCKQFEDEAAEAGEKVAVTYIRAIQAQIKAALARPTAKTESVAPQIEGAHEQTHERSFPPAQADQSSGRPVVDATDTPDDLIPQVVKAGLTKLATEKRSVAQPRIWHCRFHPTNWWHEVGCPHMNWTAEQLRTVAQQKSDISGNEKVNQPAQAVAGLGGGEPVPTPPFQVSVDATAPAPAQDELVERFLVQRHDRNDGDIVYEIWTSDLQDRVAVCNKKKWADAIKTALAATQLSDSQINKCIDEQLGCIDADLKDDVNATIRAALALLKAKG